MLGIVAQRLLVPRQGRPPPSERRRPRCRPLFGGGISMARQSKQRIAAVETCLRKLRCNRNGPAEADKRFLIAPEIEECGTAIAPILRRPRLDAERAVVALDCVR